MEGSSCVSIHSDPELGSEDEVETIDGWASLERRPFDATIADIADTSRPPWPLIDEVEYITSVTPDISLTRDREPLIFDFHAHT